MRALNIFFPGFWRECQDGRPLLCRAERAFSFLCFLLLIFPNRVPGADTSALSEWHWHTVNRSPRLPSNNIKHTQAEAGAHKFQQGAIFFARCLLRAASSLISSRGLSFFFKKKKRKERKKPEILPTFCSDFIFFYSDGWTPETVD